MNIVTPPSHPPRVCVYVQVQMVWISFFVKLFAISYVGYVHILLYILKLLQLLTLHLASASTAACVNEMGRIT